MREDTKEMAEEEVLKIGKRYERMQEKRKVEAGKKREVFEGLREEVMRRVGGSEGNKETRVALRKLKDMVMDGEVIRRDKSVVVGLMDRIVGVMNEMAEMGDVEGMLRAVSGPAVLQIAEEMRNSDSGKTRIEAAKVLLYMAGWKPVERSVSLKGDVNKISGKELDSMIESLEKKINKVKEVVVEGEEVRR